MSVTQGHPHDHGAAHSSRTRLAVAFGITATILVAQATGAVLTGSLALLVDTAHMLTDAGGLLMALIAAQLMLRPASAKHTWGLRRAEVLAAALQSLILLAVGTYAAIAAAQRLFDPPEVPAGSLLVFGIIGLAGNIAALMILLGGRNSNLNLRAAFLEVLNDALGSAAVIASAIILATTGWAQVDTLAGLLIAALIVPRAFLLLRSSVRILMESVPPWLDLDDVRGHLLENEHVLGIHDLHVSKIGTGLPVLTAHVEVDPDCFTAGHTQTILEDLRACVRDHFEESIEHTTFQLEPSDCSRDEPLPHA
ncbi:cation diffusion facilitator family transporter [Brevibacterium jeotgali]|uniref:Cobalt-zinc-cadmium efflux system protein n=1 Tax=Brevibacterium jeotgali TaxID=1262550 RepID=A0A2H1L1L0_9MICO|nr:cation diffusion facilitator family transporter [Brevibacterium jeotgali]TWC01979.1 cobalt-zinc-cadmium efflux system protein [Brevibacterium jeotgali]SMY10670.1 cobalt-zinc-cadmium efflux system protein [Brevibacterium jeotgali]